MIYVGIDNGKSGAVVALADNDPEPIMCCRTPRIGSRGDEDVPAMINLLRNLNEEAAKRNSAILIGLEATARGGGPSTWTTALVTGRVFGEWYAAAVALRMPVQIIDALTWQTAMFEGKKKRTYEQRKTAAVDVACRLAPRMCAQLLRVSANQGIADAYCIAEFLRRDGWVDSNVSRR